MDTKGTIYYKSTQIPAYADDIITVGRSIDALTETMKKLMRAT